jgi:hypothetical protein
MRYQRYSSTGIFLNFGKIPFWFWCYLLVLLFAISVTELINPFLVCYLARAIGAKFPFISIAIFMTLRNVVWFKIFPRGKFFVLVLRSPPFGVARLRGVVTMICLFSILRAAGRNMSNFVTDITSSCFNLAWTRTTGAIFRIVALWQL